MRIPFRATDRVRRVLGIAAHRDSCKEWESASAQAVAIALLDEGDGGAVEALRNAGVSLQELRQSIPFSAGPMQTAQDIINYAIEESRQLSDPYLGTQHLLLALTRFDNSLLRALANQGIDSNILRSTIQELTREWRSSHPTLLAYLSAVCRSAWRRLKLGSK